MLNISINKRYQGLSSTRSFFFKGQSVRDSTENFPENKGHSKVSSTGLEKIRDSILLRVQTDCQTF